MECAASGDDDDDDTAWQLGNSAAPVKRDTQKKTRRHRLGPRRAIGVRLQLTLGATFCGGLRNGQCRLRKQDGASAVT